MDMVYPLGIICKKNFAVEKITLDIGWALTTGATIFVSAFAIGFKYCKNIKEKEVFSECDLKDAEDKKHIATLLRGGIVPTDIKPIRINIKGNRPYHCDCRYLEFKTKKCNLNPSLKRCKLL